MRPPVALEEGAASVLRTSAALKAGERVLIVTDPERMAVGRAFFYAAAALGCDPVLSLIRPREAAGREPPDLLAAAMLEADVVLLATVHSMTHTHARRAANRAGSRVVSMPGVSEEHRFVQESGVPVLLKPFNVSDLIELVRRLLSSP